MRNTKSLEKRISNLERFTGLKPRVGTIHFTAVDGGFMAQICTDGASLPKEFISYEDYFTRDFEDLLHIVTVNTVPPQEIVLGPNAWDEIERTDGGFINPATGATAVDPYIDSIRNN